MTEAEIKLYLEDVSLESSKLNDWVQMFGILAVVASLVFIGLQMKQTQEIAIASQYHDRAALNIAGRHAHMQNDTILAMRGEHLLDQLSGTEIGEKLTAKYGAWPPVRIGYLYMYLKSAQLVMDNNHFQFESGILTEDSWYAYRSELKENLKDDFYRYLWEGSKNQYRASFRKVVDQLIVENNSVSSVDESRR